MMVLILKISFIQSGLLALPGFNPKGMSCSRNSDCRSRYCRGHIASTGKGYDIKYKCE